MSIALADTPKFSISRTGLNVHDHLSFDEWAGLAPLLNEAARGVAFVIGDWLLYGRQRFTSDEQEPEDSIASRGQVRVRSQDYETAIQLTGLDRATLQTYAYVARRVSGSLRNKDLSWEHHKIVAKLPPPDQERWLRIATENRDQSRVVSTRRLRRSISAGKLLGPKEVELPASDRGIENHIPFVNRLVTWWARMRKKGWHETATPEQRAAVKRDLEPILEIYREL